MGGNAPGDASAHRSARRAQRLILAACLLHGGPLFAQYEGFQFDALPIAGLHFVAGASLTRDSNVFRLPDGAEPPAGAGGGSSGQGDTFRTYYAGVRLDKQYSLQRFQFDYTRTAYRYDTFQQLDFDGNNLSGAWLWHLTPRISGYLRASQSESLVPFSESAGLDRNVRTTRAAEFRADALVAGGWHALLGVLRNDTVSERSLLTTPDYRLDRAEGGAKYVFTSGNSISALGRAGRGRYDHNVDLITAETDDFEQREWELLAAWRITGKSSIDGRLTWIDRNHANFPIRDVSGLTGEVAYNLVPGGKVSLRVGARRDITPYFALFPPSTHRIDQTFSIAPTWAATGSIAVRFAAERMNSDYPGGTGITSRNDRFSRFEINARWLATRNISLTASLQRQERVSTDAGAEYVDNVASIGASLLF